MQLRRLGRTGPEVSALGLGCMAMTNLYGAVDEGEAKKLGRPWEVGKAFEHSAPCSEIVPASEIGHPDHGAIWLKVNGEVRQQGDLNQMIWKTAEQVAILSRYFALQPGDVIFTGTPSGVGPVKRGDEMEAFVEGVGSLRLRVV